MEEPVKFQGCVRGRSRLEGCNYGRYPIHKFIHINDPGPMYPLWAFSIGMDEWRKECFRKRTFSDTFAVEYVQTGIFIFQQNNITMQVKPGEIFFVHLDQNNSMRCETEFATKRTIIMKGSLLRSILETLGLNRISMVVPADHEKIDRLFARLEELIRKNELESLPEMSAACYSLLLELAGQSVILQRPPELQRALDYMHSHLTEPLALDELVHHSGVSRATLHRQFRRYMKMSPINYFLDQKLERAKMLLENNLHSIKEVAEMLNYASPQYFASEFKKKFGLPPKNYKLRIRS